MNTAVINLKVEPRLKAQAQRVAGELGLSLGAIIKGYLKQLIRTKTVTFSSASEIPNEYLIKILKESEADRKAGRTSAAFDKVGDAMAWLKNPKRKYENQIR